MGDRLVRRRGWYDRHPLHKAVYPFRPVVSPDLSLGPEWWTVDVLPPFRVGVGSKSECRCLTPVVFCHDVRRRPDSCRFPSSQRASPPRRGPRDHDFDVRGTGGDGR